MGARGYIEKAAARPPQSKNDTLSYLELADMGRPGLRGFHGEKTLSKIARSDYNLRRQA
jgi:hypothetical protein